MQTTIIESQIPLTVSRYHMNVPSQRMKGQLVHNKVRIIVAQTVKQNDDFKWSLCMCQIAVQTQSKSVPPRDMAMIVHFDVMR